MKYLLLTLLLLLPAGVYGQEMRPESEEQTNIRVYRSASASVVAIRTGEGIGSGTVIDQRGLVLTNAHVLGRSRLVNVTLADGKAVTGTVVALSPQWDLALIRLDQAAPLPPLPLTTRPIQVGQRTFTIGNPFGRFAGTLTTGIITRLDPLQQLVQTNAPLQPGNSGSPLLNSDGEIIGINTAIFQSTDNSAPTVLSLAITSDRIRQFLADVQSGRVGVPPGTNILTINGNPITGRFTAQDPTLQDGSSYQIYEFSGQAGEILIIEMGSTQIDPYMVLFDPNGRQIAEDDDSGGGKNARIITRLPATGVYTLYVNSYVPRQLGSFTLSARRDQGAMTRRR